MASAQKHPLLRAIGGPLGIAEAIIPPAVFVAIYGLSGSPVGLPWFAMLTSAGLSMLFIVIRLVRREGATQAVAGLVTVLASVLLASLSNRAENNFVIGIVTNAVYGGVFLVSVLVKWPLIGVAIGLFTKKGHGWRQNKEQLRVLTWLTLMWVLMFAVRLVVEYPLYLSGNVGGLGVAKLLLGLPLYAPTVLLTWLFVRGMFAEEVSEEDEKKVS